MSHLARSSASPRHLLADAATGHLVFPWKRNQNATFLRHCGDVSEDLSEDFSDPYETDADGNQIVRELAMTQAEISACAIAGLASPWGAVGGSSHTPLVSVAPQPRSGSGSSYLRWLLLCRAWRLRVSNPQLVAVESLSATVSNFRADAGSGALLLGWRRNAGTDDAPAGLPDPASMDAVRVVDANATVPIVQSPVGAGSFEVWAWVAGALPPSGPYNRRAYVRSGYAHYKYEAGYTFSLSGRVIVNQ